MEFIFSNRYGVQAGRTPTHLYLLPHPSLRDVIAHYTLCLPAPGYRPSGILRLVPDASGCLVFTLMQSGTLEGRMYGPTTEVVLVQDDFDRCPFRFFVEFRPGGLCAFTPVPQQELADQVLSLAIIAPELQQLVASCYFRAADLDDFVRSIDALLLKQRTEAGAILPLLRHLSAAPALASAPQLSAAAGYSTRHLSRLFREGVGLSMKSFSRVLRINAAVRRLPSAGSLTRLAQDLGYYDQSHFIHDFRAVCGLTPGAYLSELTGFYNEPLKF